MILGFHGATSMSLDLMADIAVTARAGYRGLELWAAKLDTYLQDSGIGDRAPGTGEGEALSEIRSSLEANHIAPLTINSLEFIAFRRPEEYAVIRERCGQLCGWAAAIGCPTVVVVPSPLPDRNTPWVQVVAEYVRALRDLGEIAASFGVRLAFEFLGFGWCSVRTPRGAAEIIDAARMPNVGLVVDAAHFYTGGGRLRELEALDPDSLYAFHLDDLEDLPLESATDAKRLLPGEGVVPLPDICQRLASIGYQGHCSVELFRPEYWAWDADVLAARARTAALKLLSPHFEVL